jgi:hypothetical protein
MREQKLGSTAAFLLPSLKLKEPSSTAESRLHDFLMEHFGGYTAQAGNIFGYWRDDEGHESYGEHREFTVALNDDSKLPELKNFLAELARELDEQCIYLRCGEDALLIYGT